jgi:hypothetical protein
MIIKIRERTGDFAEDKDAAADIRENVLRPAVAAGKRTTLDFNGVSLVTQSFVHALVADVLRNSGEPGLKLLLFKGCSPSIRGIIGTVVQYSLETPEEA